MVSRLFVQRGSFEGRVVDSTVLIRGPHRENGYQSGQSQASVAVSRSVSYVIPRR